MRRQILEKQRKVDQLVESVKDAKIIVLFDYCGMSAHQLQDLRLQLKSTGAHCTVIKNTIFYHAAKKLNLDGIREYLKGPCAIAYTSGDPTDPPRTLLKFIEETDIEDAKKPTIKIGILENKILSAEQILQLARLGNYNEILQQFISAVNAPLSNFTTTLYNILLNFVLVLDSIKTTKEKV